MLRNGFCGFSLLILVLTSAGCAPDEGASTDGRAIPNPPGNSGQATAVIKSTFTMEVSSAREKLTALMANPTQLPVTVVNAPSANMEVLTKDFSIPTISNQVLSFGQLSLAKLTDNNLQVCGSDGRTKCNKAFIRIYTTGTAGPGFYNAADGYGMPISTSLSGASAMNVGLGASNAAVVQTCSIPANKHVLYLSDFGAAAVYKIASDFTDAGAGTYSTTLVIEYGLSL